MRVESAGNYSDTEAGKFANLTPRQLAVLHLISGGLTNLQIAQQLHMSKYTVAQHIREMFKRTGSVNRTDLVNRAYVSGALRLRESHS
jgi:DNA-binding NarL/FixJ family response regulator